MYPFLALVLGILLIPQEAKAFGNPCARCSYYLKYCCPGNCPILDTQNSLWQAVARKRLNDRKQLLGTWRESRGDFLRTLGHSGKRVSTGTPMERVSSVPGFEIHDPEVYGTPTTDTWLPAIPDAEAAKKIICGSTGRDRSISHLRSSSIADASLALPALGLALARGEQQAAAALRGGSQASDLRDLTLRLADIHNARNQIFAVASGARSVYLQMASSEIVDRKVHSYDERSALCEEQ